VRHDRADQPRQQRVSASRWRLLTGYDPLATGGRVGQRPPPDSLSLPEDAPAISLFPQAPGDPAGRRGFLHAG